MGKATKDSHLTPRQIVGISLTPEMASQFKAEAGRRNLSLKQLFEELWASYEAKSAGAKAKP